MDAKKQLAILNLAGELGPEITRYLSARGISVLSPDSGKGVSWTHVLTKDLQDFSLLNKTHGLVTNGRHAISLTRVEDLQNFTKNNGNLILDNMWLETPMGPFVLDKYFQSFGGITLGDNYPAFIEAGSFNVANPFNTGEYVDRMVSRAFEQGAEALVVKSYFDHLIMYVAGLKNMGKAGLPFEVTYGTFQDIFALQIHFFAKSLNLADLTAGLSKGVSKRPQEYYLNLAIQSADFFDFSFIPEVSKVVITGLWTQDERIRFENRGLMITALEGGIPLAQYKNDTATASIVLGSTPIGDYTERLIVPGAPSEADGLTVVEGKLLDEDSEETRIGSGVNAPEDITRVTGTRDQEEAVNRVSGSRDEAEQVTKVSSGSKEETNFTTRISSDKKESQKDNIRVQGLGEKEKNLGVLTVKSMGVGSQPGEPKTGLFNFAQKLGKSPEDLTEDEVRNFIEKDETRGEDFDHPVVKQLEQQLVSASAENDNLRKQMMTLSAELRVVKESRERASKLQALAAADAQEKLSLVSTSDDDPIRRQLEKKLLEQKALTQEELNRVTGYFEKESKLVDAKRELELKIRKLELEAIQKETFLSGELEKMDRLAKGKEIILAKTKENLTKLVERKEQDIASLRYKSDELAKALANGPAATQAQKIHDLEKQNMTFQKQLEVYKKQLANMSSNLQSSKGEDEFKEEARKLQMINQQLKNQIETGRREADKLQAKIGLDNSQMIQLRTEKSKIEQDLKKALQDAKAALTLSPAAGALEQELKKSLSKAQTHAEFIEGQLKDNQGKVATLEAKIVELMKTQKTVGVEEAGKGKTGHLETQVKKLTQELNAREALVSESKKEVNKLRAEKTALQNQVDRLKKELEKNEKSRPGAAKKPGGKVA